MKLPEERPAGEQGAVYEDTGLRVDEITDLDDLSACEEIQRLVWQPTEVEVVPALQLRAVQFAGGLAAGVWERGKLVGFSYGFPSFRPELDNRPGLHSHMTAVLPGHRNRGLGRKLKWLQRRWCLDRGIAWIEWTFDPLRAANARLNLEHLGAKVREYLPNAYGQMEDALNSGTPSDRLMAHWELSAPDVTTLETGDPRQPVSGDSERVLGVLPDGSPGEPLLESRQASLRVEIPADIGKLLATAPASAMAWRMAVREVLLHYFDRGYVATRFHEGGYILTTEVGRIEPDGDARLRLEDAT